MKKRAGAAGLCLRSLLLQAGFCDETRQALGFAWAIDPVLRRAWAGNAKGLAHARQRHLASFNTNPCAAGLVLGATAALEGRAASEPALVLRAQALKQALAASLAAVADAFFWGALRPLSAALAAAAALGAAALGFRHALAAGVLAGLLAFNVPACAARVLGASRGLAEGEKAALTAAALPVQFWLRLARRGACAAGLAAAVLVLRDRRVPMRPELAAAAFAAGAAWSTAERLP